MNDQPKADNVPAVPKPQIEAGAAVAAFIPKTIDEAFRLAQAFAQGGKGMIPQSYEGNPGAIMLAMSKGAELGMAPLAALQSIAAINGRATIWGDALPALVWRGGHRLEEWMEGDTAHCRVTRRDGAVIERTFSVEDAKTAKLWGKAGPWQQYPKRMLSMRARSWAVRDGCADLLLGLSVNEEVSDYQGPDRAKDITPAAQALRERVALARQAETKPEPARSETGDAIVDLGEDVDDAEESAPDGWTPSPDRGFPMDEEWSEGVRAYQAGAEYEDNPHRGSAGDSWAGGYLAARKADEAA